MIKILFSDFDNTMLDYYSVNNYFDDYKIDVLRRVKNKGIKFCIVTGRSIPFFKQFPNLLDVIDYIAGSNGACIYDVRNSKFLYQASLDKDMFGRVVDYLVNYDYSFLLNCMDKRYVFGDWDAVECLKYVDNWDYSCEQIIVRTDSSRFASLFNFFESIENIGINNMAKWNNYWTIDINRKDISKKTAIIWLCDYLGVDINDVIVFGDGNNDKSMFEVANKGVAVENAVDDLKLLSRHVTFSCEENGIYKYIENNILK